MDAEYVGFEQQPKKRWKIALIILVILIILGIIITLSIYIYQVNEKARIIRDAKYVYLKQAKCLSLCPEEVQYNPQEDISKYYIMPSCNFACFNFTKEEARKKKIGSSDSVREIMNEVHSSCTLFLVRESFSEKGTEKPTRNLEGCKKLAIKYNLFDEMAKVKLPEYDSSDLQILGYSCNKEDITLTAKWNSNKPMNEYIQILIEKPNHEIKIAVNESAFAPGETRTIKVSKDGYNQTRLAISGSSSMLAISGSSAIGTISCRNMTAFTGDCLAGLNHDSPECIAALKALIPLYLYSTNYTYSQTYLETF